MLNLFEMSTTADSEISILSVWRGTSKSFCGFKVFIVDA